MFAERANNMQTSTNRHPGQETTIGSDKEASARDLTTADDLVARVFIVRLLFDALRIV